MASPEHPHPGNTHTPGNVDCPSNVDSEEISDHLHGKTENYHHKDNADNTRLEENAHNNSLEEGSDISISTEISDDTDSIEDDYQLAVTQLEGSIANSIMISLPTSLHTLYVAEEDELESLKQYHLDWLTAINLEQRRRVAAMVNLFRRVNLLGCRH